MRALERTGDVRASAEDAGIDHTTAYARRRAHAEFALAWEAALKARAARVEREKAEELAGLSKNTPPHAPPHQGEGFSGSGGPPRSGEELVGADTQLKRAGHDRWSKTREKAFLTELAATGNLRHACDAVGISYEAVRKRRRKDPRLEAACQAAIEACRARIPEFLAGAAAATFDPDAIPECDANPLPKVTVAEAIKIAQLNGGAKKESATDPYDDPDYSYEDDIADIRERLVQKLQAMRRRERPELLAQGWSYDEEYDREIPPGWVRATD